MALHFAGNFPIFLAAVFDGVEDPYLRERKGDLADVVGVVGQDPMAGFVTDTVEEELAYGMESLGLPGDVMRRRVEETLDLPEPRHHTEAQRQRLDMEQAASRHRLP